MATNALPDHPPSVALDSLSQDRNASVRTSPISDSGLRLRLGWAGAALIGAAYLVWLACLHTFPFQDYPNHIARAAVMADLLFHHGAQFGSQYTLSLLPIPYVLHDLMLTVAVELFGPRAGGTFFLAIVFLSLPAAVLCYMRSAGLAPRAMLFAFLITLFLSADWFFVMAFTAYRLTLALAIVALALAQTLRRRWSAPRFAVYVAVLVLGYLMHLAGPVFFAVILGTSALVRLYLRTSTLRREIWLMAPVVAVLAIHFLVIGPLTATPGPYDYLWGTWQQKLSRLLFEFGRYGARPAAAMVLLFALCLLWPVRKALRLATLGRPEVVEMLAIAVAFAGLYVLLPQEAADSAFVDVRALSVTSLFLLLASVSLPESASAGRTFATWPVLGAASLLAVVNLAYLAKHVGADDALLTHYRELDAAVPAGARVLPINTRSKEGTILPFLHAGSLLVLDRHAIIPYLFSGDRGDAMKYFRYRYRRPYMPEEQWYLDQVKWDEDVPQTYVVEGQPYTWRFHYSRRDKQWEVGDLTPVDWDRIACGYDFIMGTRPLDMRLISVPTRVVRENDAAVLLAVDKQACHPERIVRRTVHLVTEH